MRGIHVNYEKEGTYERIIPAHAGNTDNNTGWNDVAEDHPRSCGEYCKFFIYDSIFSGSSPLMRGIPINEAADGSTIRIIPAHAGNTTIRE